MKMTSNQEFALFEHAQRGLLSLATSYCSFETDFDENQPQNNSEAQLHVLSLNWSDEHRINFQVRKTHRCKRKEDIILPFPMLHIFQYLSTPTITRKILCQDNRPFTLRLQFEKWLISTNWDEHSSITSEDWPPHLSVQTVNKMIPLLINQYPIQHRASMLVRILDGFMLFKIDLIGEYDSEEVYVYHNSVPIQISSKNQHGLSHTIQASSSSRTIKYDFHEMIMQRVLFNVQSRDILLNNRSETNLFHQSILITSPKGSGKSYFLKAIENTFHRYQSISCYYCNALAISKNVDEILEINMNFSPRQSSEGYDITKNYEESLTFILSHLFPETLNVNEDMKQKNDSSSSSLVLLIDNIDIFFQPFMNDEDRSSSSYLPYYLDQYYRLIAYHLQIIATYLRQSRSMEGRSIFIIGSSCILEKELPKSTVGSFELELVLSLPKPSFKDRCNIIYCFMSELFASTSSLLEDLSSEGLLEWMEEEIGVIFSLAVGNNSNEIKNRAVWAYRLAGLTQGYLPGDLQTLLRKVMLLSQTRLRREKVDKIANHKICWDDVIESLATTSLKAMSDLEVVHSYDQSLSGRNQLSWDSFVGYEETIQHLRFILAPLLKPSSNLQALYTQSGNNAGSLLEKYRSPRGIVLHGPSGCGKTFLSKIISKQLNANLMNIQCTDILSKYFGETESKIRHVFQVANQVSPTVLFFDEFDAIAHKREMGNDDSGGSSHGNIYNRILSTFLNELDGISVANSSSSLTSFVLVIVACKSLDILDEALIRPGRLQYHVNLDYPTTEDIRKILQHSLTPYHFTVNEETVNTITRIPELSISLIQEIVEKMKLAAVKEQIELLESGKDTTTTVGKIEERHWRQVIEDYLPVTPPSFFPANETWSFDGEIKFHSGI